MPALISMSGEERMQPDPHLTFPWDSPPPSLHHLLPLLATATIFLPCIASILNRQLMNGLRGLVVVVGTTLDLAVSAELDMKHVRWNELIRPFDG